MLSCQLLRLGEVEAGGGRRGRKGGGRIQELLGIQRFGLAMVRNG